MLKNVLLGLSVLSNLATLIGLWIAFISVPATLQAHIAHVLIFAGAVVSVVGYFGILFFVLRPEANTVGAFNEQIARLQAGQQELQDTLQRLASDLAAKPAHVPGATPPTLKQRAADLAERLLQFLKAEGPEPPHALSAGSKPEAEQRRVFNAWFDWQRRIYYGYMAQFKNDVEQVDYELAAKDIMTGLDPKEIAPPPTVGEVDAKKIAQKLLLAAAEVAE